MQRYVALRKPPVSDKNRIARLAFAFEHLNQTKEQWAAILWLDKTWVTAGSNRKTYITHIANEALDPTCILERERKKK